MNRRRAIAAALATTTVLFAWLAWFGSRHRDDNPAAVAARALARIGRVATNEQRNTGAAPSGFIIAHPPQYYPPDPDFLLHRELDAPQDSTIPLPAGTDANDTVEVIDLTTLLKSQPPVAEDNDQSILDGLPKAIDVPILAKKAPQRPVPQLPNFLEHSADREATQPADVIPPAANLWTRLRSLLWARRSIEHDFSQPMFPMSLPSRLPSYHQEHPGCPYLGGCPYDGESYRRSARIPPAIGGEEAEEPPIRQDLLLRLNAALRVCFIGPF